MVLPRFQPTLGAYVYLLMHRFDEKDNSKPAKPTAHHDPRSRSSSPVSGATPPPSGVGDHQEKENSKPAKPSAHNDHRNRSPLRGATSPPSGGGGPSEKENSKPASSPPRPASPAVSASSARPSPPEGPGYPHDSHTASSGLSLPGLFHIDGAELYVAPGHLGVMHRAHPRSIAIMRIGPPMVRVAVVELSAVPAFDVPFQPSGDRLMRGPSTFSMTGPKFFFFSQYP
jgi:hypothetical protein